MSNRCRLAGADSSQHAVAIARDEQEPSAGSLWAKYGMPVFWLAAFDDSDGVVAGGETWEDGWRVFVARREDVVRRLAQRRAAVLAYVGNVHGTLFDRFVARVQTMGSFLLFDPREICATWAKTGAEADETFHDVFSQLEAVDRGDRSSLTRMLFPLELKNQDSAEARLACVGWLD